MDHHLYNRDEVIVHTTHADSFGIIIPEETGIVWTHQSGGVACLQEEFEGYFIPLSRPRKYTEENGVIDLLSELKMFDHDGDDSRTELRWSNREEIWEEITYSLRFKFDYLPRDEIPEDYPSRGAWEWIRILGPKKRASGMPQMRVSNWSGKLEGEKAVLLYPNRD